MYLCQGSACSLQMECPICFCVLKEPYLIDCCGNSFCRTCIEPIKGASKPCPLCNIRFTATMPDRRLQRTLNELQVYCCHKEAGCEWVGQLGGLTQHLNINFRDRCDRLIECQLVGIDCTFCCNDIRRKDLRSMRKIYAQSVHIAASIVKNTSRHTMMSSLTTGQFALPTQYHVLMDVGHPPN